MGVRHRHLYWHRDSRGGPVASNEDAQPTLAANDTTGRVASAVALRGGVLPLLLDRPVSFFRSATDDR